MSLDIGLSNRFGLVVGVQGVHANIGGLEGYRDGACTYRSPTRDAGTLNVVELGRTSHFPLLIVGEGTQTMDRVGLASELTSRGASTTAVLLAGNWKSSRMVAHYSAGATAERGAVARSL